MFNSLDIVYKGTVTATLYIDEIAVKTETIQSLSKSIGRIMYPAAGNRGAYTYIRLVLDDEVYSYSISYEATPLP